MLPKPRRRKLIRMPDIVVLDLFQSGAGMVAKVRRVDGTEVRCPVIVNRDGSLGLRQPRGDWLVEPPPQPLSGQAAFNDTGEA